MTSSTHPPAQPIHSPSDSMTQESESHSSKIYEILDTLPQVWTRGLLYYLIGFGAVILTWSMTFQVDETGKARGRLEPSSKTWQVDAAVSGRIEAIQVQEGDEVTEGQLLLELDSELMQRELQQAQSRRAGKRTQLTQLELVRHQLVLALNAQRQQNQAQRREKQLQVQRAQQSVDTTQKEYELQRIEKSLPIDQAQAAVTASRRALKLAQHRYDQSKQEVRRFHQLLDVGVIPEVQMTEQAKIEAEQQRFLIQAEADLQQALLQLAQEQHRYKTIQHQTQSAVEQAKLGLAEQEKSYQGLVHAGDLALLQSEEELKKLEAQLTIQQAELEQTESRIQALEYQLQQHELKAPVSGTIFELPVQKAGAVVQSGEMVAVIAPLDTPLILKAQIATSESGLLHRGMAVKLKFDAFPFQDYGIIDGRLTEISPTSKRRETSQGTIEMFDLDIEVTQSCIQTKENCLPLMPGQTATAEVIIRQRRVIDFILDPFHKLQQGGLQL